MFTGYGQPLACLAELTPAMASIGICQPSSFMLPPIFCGDAITRRVTEVGAWGAANLSHTPTLMPRMGCLRGGAPLAVRFSSSCTALTHMSSTIRAASFDAEIAASSIILTTRANAT